MREGFQHLWSDAHWTVRICLKLVLVSAVLDAVGLLRWAVGDKPSAYFFVLPLIPATLAFVIGLWALRRKYYLHEPEMRALQEREMARHPVWEELR